MSNSFIPSKFYMKFPFLSLIVFLFLTHSLLYSQEGWRRLTISVRNSVGESDRLDHRANS
jgi:hypothetical protein